MTPPNSQNGFTLIEVLVALIVVSIGLLGFANLQTIGLRNTNSNNTMLQAIWLANDIIDKARSNVGLVDQHYSNNYSDNNPYDCSEEESEDPVDCSDPQILCTSQEMATYDRLEWRKMVCQKPSSANSRLPNASITVCIDSDPFDGADCVIGDSSIKGITPYMVKLEWDDPVQKSGRQQLIMLFQVARLPDKPHDYLDSYNAP